jgi:hypothetical protein
LTLQKMEKLNIYI